MLLRTSEAGIVTRVSSTACGSAALPRMIDSFTTDPGVPRRARIPSQTDISRVGLSSIVRR
jgi:hypothetical protein